MGKAPGLRGSREKAVGADLRTLRRTAPIRVVMYHGQSLTNDIAFGERSGDTLRESEALQRKTLSLLYKESAQKGD
jgi:hypothetical protein